MDIKEYVNTINKSFKGEVQVTITGEDSFIVYKKHPDGFMKMVELNLSELIELIEARLYARKHKEKKLKDEVKFAEPIEGYPYGHIEEVRKQGGISYYGEQHHYVEKSYHAYLDRCNINLDDETIERLSMEANVDYIEKEDREYEFVFRRPSRYS